MQCSRRRFLATALAAGFAPGARAEEPFPVKSNAWRQLDFKYQRQRLDYETAEPAGTLVVDQSKCLLYVVEGNGTAIRYGVSLGKSAHAWTGEVSIAKMTAWPVWTPTPYHIKVRPDYAQWLPDGMPGGPDNPLGARAMYLFKGNVDTVNRIHGGTKVDQIGKKKTAGCIGMLDCDVIDLYNRVSVGTRVVMLKKAGWFG
jgi:lipoprotein-anchoring transpeptidase ErfK/SrfK